MLLLFFCTTKTCSHQQVKLIQTFLQIRRKVLVLIQEWGKRFERDHDIMPLFFDVYQALLKKGLEFPGASEIHFLKKVFSNPNQEPSSPAKVKKSVDDLPPKYQKIIQEMNLLKGNINFTNELLDETRTRQQLKENETVLDLLKALKEMENKLFELIQSCENEDVMAVCLLVNEDMQKTFTRFKQIKNNERPESFMPGEYL